MLHPYQSAQIEQYSIKNISCGGKAGQELLYLLWNVNDWLGGAVPTVQGALTGKTIYLIYRDVTFPVDDFWDSFGIEMAKLNDFWPISVFGTAGNQETVRLQAYLQQERLYLSQENISGKSTEALTTLCFQIDCQDQDTAQNMLSLLYVMNWTTGIAAIDWKNAEFFKSQGLLLDPGARSFFCYVGLNLNPDLSNCLRSLHFSQKIALWNSFLKERMEPVEFEWLAELVEEKDLDDRMEWELALTEVMDQLGFQIISRQKVFELYNGDGERLYFGVDDRRIAGRVLLKILFPLNN